MRIWRYLSLICLLAPLQSWAQTFNATQVTAIKSVYAFGESVTFQTQLKSSVATAKAYHVEARILDPAGKALSTQFTYTVSLSSAAAKTVMVPFKMPASGAGIYTYSLRLWETNWSKSYAIVGGDAKFNVGVAPAVAFSLTANPLSKSAFNRGDVLAVSTSIKSNQATAKSYHVQVRVMDVYGKTLHENYFYTQSLSATAKALNFSYTLPAAMVPGQHKIAYAVWETNWSKSYSVTPLSTAALLFSVESYQPNLASLNIPRTAPLLKPKGTTNPLDGSGFIPNTGDTYTMIFNDEFNGTALDTSKWWTRFVYNGGTLNTLNDECQYYTENNTHVVGGGVLKLTARPRPGTVCNNNAKYTRWDSGMLRSKTIMKYGYFEARLKFPKGNGVWAAFWLNPEDQKWPPEIDIFEYVINGVTEFANMIHSGVVHRSWLGNYPQNKKLLYKDPNFNTQWTFWKAPAAIKPSYFNDGYHIVSGFWNDDNTYTTYVDGVPIVNYDYFWVHEDGTDAGFAHVLLNLAMGGNWGTSNWTSTMTKENQELSVDYVRVYQKSNKINKGTSVTGKNLCPAAGGC